MKLYICSISFYLKKKTNPSSLQRLQGKDLPIVTRTHRLVWSNLIRKLEAFQVKKKKLGIWFTFRNRIWVRVVLLTNLCNKCWPACSGLCFSTVSTFLSVDGWASIPRRSSHILPGSIALLPLGCIPRDVRGPKGSWHPASSKDHPHSPLGWCVIIHFDNFIMITGAESRFNSPRVWIWTVLYLQSQISSMFGWGRSEWQRFTVLSHKDSADWGTVSRGMSHTLLFLNGNVLIAYFIFMTL